MLADMLGGKTAVLLELHTDTIAELRLRVNQMARLCLLDGCCLDGDQIDHQTLHQVLNRLMENSMYACEHQLRQGYFTSLGGCRVGVCGHIPDGGSGISALSSIGSACIRFPREIPGCADALVPHVCAEGLRSILILSVPGFGKTTMLRDLVRCASEKGYNVCVSDERREIAACVQGVPQMNLGPNTDVMDGLPKSMAIPMLMRACAPDLIVVDELGDERDALAVLEARRCGVAVAATAHAGCLEDALARKCTGELLRRGAFDFCALLGPGRGQILSLYDCKKERFQYAEDLPVDSDIALLHGGGPNGFCSEKTAQ